MCTYTLLLATQGVKERVCIYSALHCCTLHIPLAATRSLPGRTKSLYPICRRVPPVAGAWRATSRKSRDKGNRVERAIVAALRRHGFAAERVPLSGAARGRFGGGLFVPLLGVDRWVEVKARRHGFAEFYRWLVKHDLLILKRDRSEPLVVLWLSEAARIAAPAQGELPQ
jgi:hypothetical protein